MQSAKCKVQIEDAVRRLLAIAGRTHVFHFTICTLHFAFCNSRSRSLLRIPLALLIVVAFMAFSNAPADEPPPQKPSATKDTYTSATLRGRVVWMADAMARRHGVKVVAEARDRVLALETADGQLLPILEDVRGRAFREDTRLMGIDLELLVRQHRGSPMLQVIGVSAIEKGDKFEIDYWCEVCSIAMYELKPCECCQGETELRRRRVTEKPARAGK